MPTRRDNGNLCLSYGLPNIKFIITSVNYQMDFKNTYFTESYSTVHHSYRLGNKTFICVLVYNALLVLYESCLHVIQYIA